MQYVDITYVSKKREFCVDIGGQSADTSFQFTCHYLQIIKCLIIIYFIIKHYFLLAFTSPDNVSSYREHVKYVTKSVFFNIHPSATTLKRLTDEVNIVHGYSTMF